MDPLGAHSGNTERFYSARRCPRIHSLLHPYSLPRARGGDSGEAACGWVHAWGRDVSEGDRAPSPGPRGTQVGRLNTPPASPALAPRICAPGGSAAARRLARRAKGVCGRRPAQEAALAIRRRATGWSRYGWQLRGSTCCGVGAHPLGKAQPHWAGQGRERRTPRDDPDSGTEGVLPGR